MKHLLLVIILTSFASIAFAEQTETDCPMMREQNERSNPKADAGEKIVKQDKQTSSTAQ